MTARINQKRLILSQISQQIARFGVMHACNRPANGWLKAIREAIGMSTEQLARRMNAQTRSAISNLEKREKHKSITLTALEDAARAMDMKVAYILLPIDPNLTLEKYVRKRAEEVATKIVRRTAATMKLEDQETSKKRQQKAIKELTEDIIREMPSILWD
jgi:predicted DNA-binding mobile mystery protein A|nr:MAG: mobile mystery protein A [Bacteroidota bacterium]